MFVIADKESAVFYTMLFGYFPVLSLFLNEKIRSNLIRFVIKFLVFNGSVISAVLICSFVFGITYDDLFSDGIVFILIFIVLLNVLFVIFDLLIDRLCLLYVNKLQKKFRKLFKVR